MTEQQTQSQTTEQFASILERLAFVQEQTAQANASLALALTRIADRLDPPPSDIVGTDYPAAKLGCSETWIAEQARSGKLPSQCIVPGTGRGRTVEVLPCED